MGSGLSLGQAFLSRCDSEAPLLPYCNSSFPSNGLDSKTQYNCDLFPLCLAFLGHSFTYFWSPGKASAALAARARGFLALQPQGRPAAEATSQVQGLVSSHRRRSSRGRAASLFQCLQCPQYLFMRQPLQPPKGEVPHCWFSGRSSKEASEEHERPLL